MLLYICISVQQDKWAKPLQKKNTYFLNLLLYWLLVLKTLIITMGSFSMLLTSVACPTSITRSLIWHCVYRILSLHEGGGCMGSCLTWVLILLSRCFRPCIESWRARRSCTFRLHIQYRHDLMLQSVLFDSGRMVCSPYFTLKNIRVLLLLQPHPLLNV